jgi:hypothetical protein
VIGKSTDINLGKLTTEPEDSGKSKLSHISRLRLNGNFLNKKMETINANSV